MDRTPRGLEGLGLDSRLVGFLREKWGIEELFPPQIEALPNALEGNNLMLTIPTASGKSLVAYLTMLHRLSGDLSGSRGLYIVPLKALASEKVGELQEIAASIGLSVGIAIGDRSSENVGVNDADIIVCTSEKLDSMLRANGDLLSKIGIVVSDEFHLLNDHSRGPTLEVLISRIRHEKPDAQIIALSATVGNAESLAEWLDADLVKSEWRPVSLHCGVMSNLEVRVHRIEGDEPSEWPSERKLSGNKTKSLQAVLDDTVSSGGQLLVFVSSRASAQKEARDLSEHVLKTMSSGDGTYYSQTDEKWSGFSSKINRGEESSSVGKSLSNSIKGGVAFHHAGLTSSQRGVIEGAFKDGSLNCIIATPTLAQGVNLPARRVVIRDYRRWNTAASASMPLPIMEIRQMMGRAGRPKYDEHGDSWIIAKDVQEEERLVDLYLKGGPEDVISKLASPMALRAVEDPALLTHCLSIIATGGVSDRYSLGRFFEKTFLATQMNSETLAGRLDDVIDWLANNGMVNRDGESEKVATRMMEEQPDSSSDEDWEDDAPSWANSAADALGIELSSHVDGPKEVLPKRRGPPIFGFRKASIIEPEESISAESPSMTYSATPLGKRVARLYLNPLSGRILRDGASRAMSILSGRDESGQVSPMGLLHLVSCTPDFMPLWIRKNDFDRVQAALHGHEREFLAESIDLEDDRRMKAALVIQSWMEEDSFEAIETDWGVQPGDLRSRVELAEWLLYSTRQIVADDDELSLMGREAHRTLVEAIDEVHRRVRYGCKSDLLGLVALRGVGRVRAREMARLLGVSEASDIAELTERDRSMLSDLRGWSPKLVDNLVQTASRAVRRRSR
ncbi:MAG: DEAD/DEAH box helicase [Candidatus Thermoplasmatota archaeon]|nr:DEAD/DEAH box helicase [Candidatus Thermoplasmatota archaeon]